MLFACMHSMQSANDLHASIDRSIEAHRSAHAYTASVNVIEFDDAVRTSSSLSDVRITPRPRVDCMSPKFWPDDFAQEKNEPSRTALFVLGEIAQKKKGRLRRPVFFLDQQIDVLSTGVLYITPSARDDASFFK